MTAAERYIETLTKRRRELREEADVADTFTRLALNSKAETYALVIEELERVFRDVADEATFGIEVAA